MILHHYYFSSYSLLIKFDLMKILFTAYFIIFTVSIGFSLHLEKVLKIKKKSSSK